MSGVALAWVATCVTHPHEPDCDWSSAGTYSGVVFDGERHARVNRGHVIALTATVEQKSRDA